MCSRNLILGACIIYLFKLRVNVVRLINNVLVFLCVIFLNYMCCPRLCSHGGWLLQKCFAIGIAFNGAETNYGIARIFRHPTDEQLGHLDIFFSNYYNLQSVYFELNELPSVTEVFSRE